MGGWQAKAPCEVRVYLAHFTKSAKQLLYERYGSTVIVDSESRQWRSTSSTG